MRSDCYVPARTNISTGKTKTPPDLRRSGLKVCRAANKNTTQLALRRCSGYCLAAFCIRLNISPRFSQSFTWGGLTCCRFRSALTCRFYKAPRLAAMTSLIAHRLRVLIYCAKPASGSTPKRSALCHHFDLHQATDMDRLDINVEIKRPNHHPQAHSTRLYMRSTEAIARRSIR